MTVTENFGYNVQLICDYVNLLLVGPSYAENLMVFQLVLLIILLLTWNVIITPIEQLNMPSPTDVYQQVHH